MRRSASVAAWRCAGHDEHAAVASLLRGQAWLWIAPDTFARAEQVAFRAPSNAAPYLYAVPPHLLGAATMLSAFGVRESFGPSDYVDVLRTMATQCDENRGGTVTRRPLTDIEVRRW
jgi:hypothetical protein